jgi:hypothetical protein
LKVLDKLTNVHGIFKYYSYEKEELINVEDQMIYLIHRLKGEFGVPQTEIQELLDQIEEV